MSRWGRTLSAWCLLVLGLLAGTSPLSGATKETWIEVRSPHFVAYSDAGEAQARKVLREFEEIRHVFQTVFPGLQVDAPKPMILIVTLDESSMKRFLPKEFEGEHPKKDAGVYQAGPDRNYAILRMDANVQTDQPFQVLFHEFTHGVLFLNFSSLPTWLNEGMAEFYGATEIRSDRVLIGKVPRGSLETIRNSVFLPLETLLRVTQDSPHYQESDKTGVFYAQSWLLVHYLLMDEQAQKGELLKHFLAALEQNPDPMAAARASFGDLDTFFGKLVLYARQSRFRFWDYKLSVRLTDQELASRTLEPAAALVVRGEFLQNSHQEKESRALLQEALRLNPKLPEVQVALGYGHYLRQETEPAIGAFEAALRLGSSDFRPHYYLARLDFETHRLSQEEAGRTLEHLERASRLCPDFPGIQILLCMHYSMDPTKAGQALEAGKRAIQSEPRNLSLRANLGFACMNLGLGSQAKAIGEQLKALAHEPGERDLVNTYEDALNRFQERARPPIGDPAAATTFDPEPPAEPGLGPQKPARTKKLKFQLPSTLTALGQEVLQLVSQGNTQAAIQKVEAALAKATVVYDRKALQNLLEQLRP